MSAKKSNFSVNQRFKSFKYAFEGFKVLLKSEHNARVHLFFTVLAVILGLILKISNVEWALIVFAIGFVFVAEVFNTCIEEVCDFICAEQDFKIKKIKDLAALAVLLSAISAFVIGLLVFLPKIIC